MKTKKVPEKKFAVIDGYTIKYHANGKTIWSKGKMVDGMSDGYWEWYRPDGTLKRSGYFAMGENVGEWTTYNSKGEVYKVTKAKPTKPSVVDPENCPV
jgi:antitoxin component YwqK of YwqJK toxin-antitoxin module